MSEDALHRGHRVATERDAHLVLDHDPGGAADGADHHLGSVGQKLPCRCLQQGAEADLVDRVRNVDRADERHGDGVVAHDDLERLAVQVDDDGLRIEAEQGLAVLSVDGVAEQVDEEGQRLRSLGHVVVDVLVDPVVLGDRSADHDCEPRGPVPVLQGVGAGDVHLNKLSPHWHRGPSFC